MISSYQEALRFLYDNLPMFQRLGAAAIKKDLTNTLRLCAILGDPQKTFRSIHVAGTNGKGSTCHMLASVLQTAGYKTGLYTSPHLKQFTERIRVNGGEIAQSFVVDFVNRMMPAIEEIHPSFFEITVAMAFDYFAHEQVDIAVIETGLGGKLDSTNVITPVVSVITNISWDHKDVLGNTLQEIAAEKAGIIKRGIPAVVSERQPEVEHVFIRSAREQDVDLYFASDEYSATEDAHGNIEVRKMQQPYLTLIDFPLKGSYQRRNIPGVIRTVDVLRRELSIGIEQLKEGLRQVVAHTGLKGRWQILQHNPMVVCDTGHNEDGIREVLRQVAMQSYSRLFIILGMVKDKDAKQILSLMPTHAVYYFCEAKLPRALDAETLQREAGAFGLKGEVVRDVNDARRKALSAASKDDLVFIGGSTYVVAELEEL